MSKYFAGIRPIKAGYEEFMIQPQLPALDRCDCVVPSVKGMIRMAASKTDGAFLLDASVPKDTTAFIYLPYADGQSVKLNDRVIFQKGSFVGTDEAAFIELSDGRIVFSISAAEDMVFHVSVQ